MHGRWVLVVLAFLWCLAQGVPAGAAQAVPVARAGHLALDAVPQQPLPLRGDWGFAWHRFVDPSWDSLPTRAFAQVPANWNDLRADGKPEGEDGWGSYVLQVDCPVGRSLAVEALAERTASRLYINGTLVAQQGRVGETPEQTWSTVHNRVPITAAFACPLRITLHVTNFDHRAGGFVRPLVAGTPEALALRRESQIIDATALLAAYLLPGLVALIFYAARRRERVPLVFGLFCIAMAVYTDMIGQRLFLRPLPAQVDWWGYMRVEYLSWIAAMALWVLTLRGLFPQEIHRRVVQAVQATLAASALAVILLPPAVYSHLATPGLVVAIAVIAYFACAMVLALRRTRVDAGILLAGILAVLLSFGIDLLLIDAPRADTKFAPIGLAVFLLSPAVVIARRLSAALNAEERNRALEENARLREDVERMSRHDLKTPLNSILGATRLLRDDPALGREQLELVDVLQQAGVRMLDMVNLSLGLFRMETGRYELRPQAVDLREVVTRVLVDLHSYAEASTVTLHLRGSDRTPMRVRAEEPLCYSIVANLVKNAVEAAGAGGHVVMALEHGPPVTLTVHNPGEVPPEIADRFFEKYVTGRKSGGTGLGTYSARLMARAQQGELRMHTGPRGTTLTLTLPAHRGGGGGRPRPGPRRPGAARRAGGGRRRVHPPGHAPPAAHAPVPDRDGGQRPGRDRGDAAALAAHRADGHGDAAPQRAGHGALDPRAGSRRRPPPLPGGDAFGRRRGGHAGACPGRRRRPLPAQARRPRAPAGNAAGTGERPRSGGGPAGGRRAAARGPPRGAAGGRSRMGGGLPRLPARLPRGGRGDGPGPGQRRPRRPALPGPPAGRRPVGDGPALGIGPEPQPGARRPARRARAAGGAHPRAARAPGAGAHRDRLTGGKKMPAGPGTGGPLHAIVGLPKGGHFQAGPAGHLAIGSCSMGEGVNSGNGTLGQPAGEARSQSPIARPAGRGEARRGGPVAAGPPQETLACPPSRWRDSCAPCSCCRCWRPARPCPPRTAPRESRCRRTGRAPGSVPWWSR